MQTSTEIGVPATLAPFSRHRGGSAEIEIRSIIQDGEAFIATITDGRRNWMVKLKATDLQSVARFQAVVAVQHGLWISHQSQESRVAAIRRRDWQDAVSRAFDAGVPK